MEMSVETLGPLLFMALFFALFQLLKRRSRLYRWGLVAVAAGIIALVTGVFWLFNPEHMNLRAAGFIVAMPTLVFIVFLFSMEAQGLQRDIDRRYSEPIVAKLARKARLGRRDEER